MTVMSAHIPEEDAYHYRAHNMYVYVQKRIPGLQRISFGALSDVMVVHRLRQV